MRLLLVMRPWTWWPEHHLHMGRRLLVMVRRDYHSSRLLCSRRLLLLLLLLKHNVLHLLQHLDLLLVRRGSP